MYSSLIYFLTIIIVGTVGFSETSYSFVENIGGQFCIVFEQGGTEIDITLGISSMDGTATGKCQIIYIHAQTFSFDHESS